MTDTKRARTEQRHVVLLNDGSVIGTPAGGPLTRDAAWLLERWYIEFHPELGAKALQIQPRATEEDE